MKTWPSLAEAAVDLKISERTAFRWLRTGRIAKRKDEDGRLVFVLTSEVIDTATTDSHDMSDSPKSVSNDTESNRTQRKRVSVESERISIALDCLKALYILRTEATSRVRSCQGAKKIKWVADEAQEGMIFWMKIERDLNNVYVGIEKGVGVRTN